MKNALLILLLLLSTQLYAQNSSLVMQSEPGDYIGQGQNYDLNEGNGTFTAFENSDNSVRIAYDGDDGFFSVSLAPKDNYELIVGPYPDATRHPFNSPTTPGLSASGFGRGCNTSVGHFTVLDIAFDGNDDLLYLVADFEQHCGTFDDPALTGTLVYNHPGTAYPPVPDQDADGVADTIDNCVETPNVSQGDLDLDGIGNACDYYFTNTNFTLDSEVGDYIGQGEFQEFYLQDGNITASRNFDNGVSIRFNGLNSWSLDFAAPGDVELSAGVYNAATRFPFQDPTEPGLNVSGAGRGCNTLTGDFEVTAIVFDSLGEVEQFEAVFEQHCEGNIPALFGEVNFNLDIDLIFADDFE